MKKIVMTLATILVAISSFAWDAPEKVTIDWIRDNYTKREVKITMRDGVGLYTVIYEPNDKSEPHPILMERSCYGSGPYGDAYARLDSQTYALYMQAGYIMVFQDVRGKNMSEGVFEDIRPFIEGKKAPRYNRKGEIIAKPGTPIDEASDTYDTADWLVKNTNSNGNIGVQGISYPGFFSTMAALSGHPAIKAVSPQAPVTDWYRGDDAHHNGAFFLLDMFSFQYWFEYLNVQGERPYENPADIVRTDVYNDYMKYRNVPAFTELFKGKVAGWNDVLEHPDLDDWWEERNVLYHIKDVKPAIMVVGGLFDAEDCYGAWATYEAFRTQSPQTETYLVEGPWSHGAWSRGAQGYMGDIWFGDDTNSSWYLNNVEYPFFAYYLEGKGSKPEAKARVFHTGENRWHSYADGWQPASSTLDIPLGKVTYTSDPDHPVPFTGVPRTSRNTADMLLDQRFASTRPDVAVFTSDVLTDSVKLSGEVIADLMVSMTGTDADFIVKLIDVFPDDFRYPRETAQKMGSRAVMAGYQMLVRWEVMRGKYRNSFRDPEPFVPGEKTRVKLVMPGAAHTFLPGHRIMVQVQSSCFPLIDINPQTFCNIYEADLSVFQKSDITIWPESHLSLPVLK